MTSEKEEYERLSILFKEHLRDTKGCKPSYIAQRGNAECTLITELNALVFYGICPPKKNSALFNGLLRMAWINEEDGGASFSQHKKWNTTNLLGLRRKVVFRGSEYGLWDTFQKDILDKVISCLGNHPVDLILEKSGNRHSCLVVDYEPGTFVIANYFGKKPLVRVKYAEVLPLVDTLAGPELLIRR